MSGARRHGGTEFAYLKSIHSPQLPTALPLPATVSTHAGLATSKSSKDLSIKMKSLSNLSCPLLHAVKDTGTATKWAPACSGQPLPHPPRSYTCQTHVCLCTPMTSGCDFGKVPKARAAVITGVAPLSSSAFATARRLE